MMPQPIFARSSPVSGWTSANNLIHAISTHPYPLPEIYTIDRAEDTIKDQTILYSITKGAEIFMDLSPCYIIIYLAVIFPVFFLILIYLILIYLILVYLISVYLIIVCLIIVCLITVYLQS